MKKIGFVMLPCVLLLMVCTGVQITDNSTSETTNGIMISGCVREYSDVPADSATVRLILQAQTPVKPDSTVDSSVTDSKGRFFFERVRPGTYFIRGRKENRVFHSQPIEVADRHMEEEYVLSETGSLRTSVAFQDTFDAKLILENTTYSVTAPLGSELVLDDILPGKYWCTVFLTREDFPEGSIIFRQQISIYPNQTRITDPIQESLFGADTVLVDDFETDDTDSRNPDWFTFGDSTQTATVSMVSDYSPGAHGSQGCLRAHFDFSDSGSAGVGSYLGYRSSSLSTVFNAANLKEITFLIKGTPADLSLKMSSVLTERELEIVLDTISPQWTEIKISLDSLSSEEQIQWSRCCRYVSHFSIQAKSSYASKAEIFIDDLKFVFQ